MYLSEHGSFSKTNSSIRVSLFVLSKLWLCEGLSFLEIPSGCSLGDGRAIHNVLSLFSHFLSNSGFSLCLLPSFYLFIYSVNVPLFLPSIPNALFFPSHMMIPSQADNNNTGLIAPLIPLFRLRCDGCVCCTDKVLYVLIMDGPRGFVF